MSHELAAQDFHDSNPHICDILVKETLRLRYAGVTHISMDKLFGTVRWSEHITTVDDKFKMNNNYSSFYARLVMEKEPLIEGMFAIRTLNLDRSSGTKDLQVGFEKDMISRPEIYTQLVRAASRLKTFGTKKTGIKGLAKDNKIKLNNTFGSRYARLIMKQEKDLKGFFTLRTLKNTVGQ